MQRILVWDWPVRVGHWLMVSAFCIAWLTGDSDHFRLLHAIAGATVVGVASFRISWGFIGTRHARFGEFLRGPGAVRDYFASLLKLEPAHHTGHNPLGGWAIIILLGLAILSGFAGWATHHELGGHWLEELHEGLAAILLAAVIVHLAGVVAGSLLHGENLVRAMLHGHKQGSAETAIASARPRTVLILLGWVVTTCWLIAN